MVKIEYATTIEDTWIVVFKLNNNENLLFLDCEEILSFPYAKELIPNELEFQNMKVHETKLSWSNERIDICVDRLVEDGKELKELIKRCV